MKDSSTIRHQESSNLPSHSTDTDASLFFHPSHPSYLQKTSSGSSRPSPEETALSIASSPAESKSNTGSKSNTPRSTEENTCEAETQTDPVSWTAQQYRPPLAPGS